MDEATQAFPNLRLKPRNGNRIPKKKNPNESIMSPLLLHNCFPIRVYSLYTMDFVPDAKISSSAVELIFHLLAAIDLLLKQNGKLMVCLVSFAGAFEHITQPLSSDGVFPSCHRTTVDVDFYFWSTFRTFRSGRLKFKLWL